MILGAGEIEEPVRFLHEMPGLRDGLVVLVQQVHVREDVAGEYFARGLAALALLDFGHPLGGKDDFVDILAHFFGGDAADHVVTHALLQARADMKDIPLVVRLGNGRHEGRKKRNWTQLRS